MSRELTDKKTKKQKKIEGESMARETGVLIIILILVIAFFVPTVDTLSIRVCITQDGEIQDVAYQKTKVPYISTISNKTQQITFYSVMIEGLPKYLQLYSKVGCNSLYWYRAKNGEYSVDVTVFSFIGTSWEETDSRNIPINVAG